MRPSQLNAGNHGGTHALSALDCECEQLLQSLAMMGCSLEPGAKLSPSPAPLLLSEYFIVVTEKETEMMGDMR